VNPVAVVRATTHEDGRPLSRSVYVWCPGCRQVHPFRVDNTGCPERPTWTWNGDLERPTFSPSLLCHSSFHRCGDEHLVPCSGVDCGHVGHRVLDDGSLATAGPHTVEPPYGDCHSFLTEGRWQYLGDCAHELAGQTVELTPLPDWFMDHA